MACATCPEALEAACEAAKEQRVLSIGVEQQGPRWTVKADALTAPQRTIDPAVYNAVREAVIRLIHSQEIRPDSSAGPIYSTCTTWTTSHGPASWPPPCTPPSTATSNS
ncbi:hypothetical protein ACFRAO_34625 [Streptomyces sp. NPDC056656]|uniref:hypothetical protein n=1 Tax=Streptomyces sp. NPDC056656 TaxID=3345895 RepID=UPI0036BBEE62